MKTYFAMLAMLTLPLAGAEKVVEKPEQKVPQVAVGGQVQRPGWVEYRHNTTVLAMIFAAGGPTQFGAMNRVKVIRAGKTLQYDLTKEKDKNQALALPDDTIEVPMKNLFGR